MVEKITRASFIFFGPKTPDEEEDFAQCGPCRVFVPQIAMKGMSGSRCVFHGSKMDVDEDDSCGLMTPWPTPNGQPNPQVVKDHAAELMKGIPGSLTPEISGFVKRRVQCHRCYWAKAGATICGLYEMLNKMAPQVFDLDPKITPHSCCNAQTPKAAAPGMRREESGSDAVDDDDKAPMFGRMGGT